MLGGSTAQPGSRAAADSSQGHLERWICWNAGFWLERWLEPKQGAADRRTVCLSGLICQSYPIQTSIMSQCQKGHNMQARCFTAHCSLLHASLLHWTNGRHAARRGQDPSHRTNANAPSTSRPH
jgi:hypothetical protein